MGSQIAAAGGHICLSSAQAIYQQHLIDHSELVDLASSRSPTTHQLANVLAVDKDFYRALKDSEEVVADVPLPHNHHPRRIRSIAQGLANGALRWLALGIGSKEGHVMHPIHQVHDLCFRTFSWGSLQRDDGRSDILFPHA